MSQEISHQYHPSLSQIVKLLEENHVWFETFEHEPVLTSAQAAELRDGYTLHQGAKALLAKIKIPNAEKRFVMLVLPGDMRFNSKKAQAIFGAKDIRFATEEEVGQITNGILPGGVPPFGNLFGLEMVVDPHLFENEKIIFNAGDRTYSIGMFSQDYRNILQPRVEEMV